MDVLIDNIRYKVQHFNLKKYFKYRKIVTNSKNNKLIRLYCLYKIKKMDAFNNASLGTKLEKSSKIESQPIFPHGLNGIMISKFATIGKNCVIYHQVTIGSKDDKTAPTIGNNVVIYPGAKIIGNIKIADDVIIGTNAVVTRDCLESGVILGWVSARVIGHKK